MPFYEYECSNCRFYVEVLQKISEPPLKKCPSCSKKTLKKLVSAPVFRLKGSGWYETDFKSDKEDKRNLAGADKEESASDAKAADPKPAVAAEAKGDSKADTKPDAKSDAKSDSKPTDKADSKSGGASVKRGKDSGKTPKRKAAAGKPASKRVAAKAKPSGKRRRTR